MYMTYNPDIKKGSNITGMYMRLTNSLQASFYAMVTEAEVQLYRNQPNGFRIDAGVFSEIVRTSEDVSMCHVMAEKSNARDAILAPILIEDREYIPDINFQMNVSMGLHLLSHKQRTSILLWCKIANEWVHRAHSTDEVLAIAAAIVQRRETISSHLYVPKED